MVVYVMKRSLGSSTLGASGVVTALLGTSCVLHEGKQHVVEAISTTSNTYLGKSSHFLSSPRSGREELTLVFFFFS